MSLGDQTSPQARDEGQTALGSTGFLPRERLQSLFDALARLGYRCIGPQVGEGAIQYRELTGAASLPVGYRDRQAPGEYHLEESGDERCFGWSNGPQALKPLLFKPLETLWRATRGSAGELEFVDVEPQRERWALIGARACDLAALALHDKHFLDKVADPWYEARRSGLLLVGVDCSHPAATCFCASTGDGPAVDGRADIALSELETGFWVRAYSENGAAVRDALPLEQATGEQRAQAAAQLDQVAEAQTRRLPGRNLRNALFGNLEHPRWAEVGERCLSCGNCVAVCPTCFCAAERDTTDLARGTAEHERRWDSCYSAEHSYLHGHLLRPDTRLRYRQWLTHKLGGWHDQYGRAGCVGCGRCITWCPVGIDITEEATAICGPLQEGPAS